MRDNDEAWFRTLKYAAVFSERFGTLHHAAAKTVARSLAQARAARAERFSNHQNPRILALPEAAWFNQPPVL